MKTKNLSSSDSVAILWFRRDLRLSDHPALSAAAESGARIVPVYILDDDTPGNWRMGGASRWRLAQSLTLLERSLLHLGSGLIFRRGRSEDVLRDLVIETGAGDVYFTRGYEPFQRRLEDRLKEALAALGVECLRFGGHILVEPGKILNKSGEPFRVYTPFFNALTGCGIPRRPLPAPAKLSNPLSWPRSDAIETWGLEPTAPDWSRGIRATWLPGEAAAQQRLQIFIETMVNHYRDQRNLPAADGTSRLSPHLAFGEISARQIWNAVSTSAETSGMVGDGETYLKEIAWREFSYHLLFHFPSLPEKALKPEFDAFPWRDNATALRRWQKGETGYPIVDAGMRQLWQTGWMHNRVRMIAASFLIKHLLVPWQKGAAWFWDTLVDADLASNAASWQWVAGSGADAAPYFRIFNPVLQGEKFDPSGDYVRAYCPELGKLPASIIHKPWAAEASVLAGAGVKIGTSYPPPIVEHREARRLALAAYETIKTAK